MTCGTSPRERRGELVGRLADQVGLGDAREVVAQAVDAALLRLPAGDPVDRVEGGQRARRGVGVGGLGIVDEEHRAAPADHLHAVGEAGEALHGGEDDAAVEAERARRGPGGRGVLPVVRAAQRRQVGEGDAVLAVRPRAARRRRRRRALAPLFLPTETVTSFGRPRLFSAAATAFIGGSSMPTMAVSSGRMLTKMRALALA